MIIVSSRHHPALITASYNILTTDVLQYPIRPSSPHCLAFCNISFVPPPSRPYYCIQATDILQYPIRRPPLTAVQFAIPHSSRRHPALVATFYDISTIDVLLQYPIRPPPSSPHCHAICNTSCVRHPALVAFYDILTTDVLLQYSVYSTAVPLSLPCILQYPDYWLSCKVPKSHRQLVINMTHFTYPAHCDRRTFARTAVLPSGSSRLTATRFAISHSFPTLWQDSARPTAVRPRCHVLQYLWHRVPTTRPNFPSMPNSSPLSSTREPPSRGIPPVLQRRISKSSVAELERQCTESPGHKQGPEMSNPGVHPCCWGVDGFQMDGVHQQCVEPIEALLGQRVKLRPQGILIASTGSLAEHIFTVDISGMLESRQ
ncbi:hypothetical protein JVU11DRAFT_9113 [Chiua virens]|nr:hypothetical protein JVU11DRAFT_9113 [Chiua virens]